MHIAGLFFPNISRSLQCESHHYSFAVTVIWLLPQAFTFNHIFQTLHTKQSLYCLTESLFIYAF